MPTVRVWLGCRNIMQRSLFGVQFGSIYQNKKTCIACLSNNPTILNLFLSQYLEGKRFMYEIVPCTTGKIAKEF